MRFAAVIRPLLHRRRPQLVMNFRSKLAPIFFLGGLALLFACAFSGAQADPQQQPAAEIPDVIEFNRDVRPILSDNCFHCHGPDRNKREADLRLDTQAGLLGETAGNEHQGGVVSPGKPDESELLRRITSEEDYEHMPPPDSNKTLSERQIEIIRRWIEQGAQYQGHWAYLPLRPQSEMELPAEITSDSAAIDHFVQQQRKRHNLQAAQPADDVTLLRRLHFDVVGLPPMPEEVVAFLHDESPNAYERQVDRLLASPHFGERMAMWWLDLVRYADTVGYHGDQDISVSPFRDYVIQSFNENKPFDQFTIEQLAGDLLDSPSQTELIGSGYNRLGMMSAEGGVQDKEYLAKYIAERVRNVSGTWLGVTMGCCECHDHKFDPFSTREFYMMEAFFADIKERGLYSGANNDGNWGPSIKVPTAEQQDKMQRFDEQIAQLKTTLQTPTAELAAAQATWEESQPVWTVLPPESAGSKNGATLTTQADNSVLASGESPAMDTYTVTIADVPHDVTALRLEVLPDDSLPNKGPGRAGNGNFVLSEFIVKAQMPNGEERIVPIASAIATHEQPDNGGKNPFGKWPIAAAIDHDEQGETWGWAILNETGKPHVAVFQLEEALQQGATLTIQLQQNHTNPKHTIGSFRLSGTASPSPQDGNLLAPAEIAELVAVDADARSPQQVEQLAAYYRSIAPALEPTRQELAKVEKSRTALDKQITTTPITQSVEPRTIRVLARGNWQDETGDVVLPGFPQALTAEETCTVVEDRLTRLDLAHWITANDNPLTARVLVNRIWKLYFGAGLSRKLDDLGAQGEPPSHPLLLDYLAGRLIESGWDVKALIKSILLSETYRQSSLTAAEVLAADPTNRWLARQNRFRLDAELVRDNALAVSGLVVDDVGGRSVKPYQPPGYWAYLNFPTREWQNGSGEELYRRGLYTHWQRQYLHPSLLAFDAPTREECTADRPRSNTPLQSLVLLNDPSYVEAARAFAELILRDGGTSTTDRLNFAYGRALSRSTRAEEVEILTALLEQATNEYQDNSKAASELLSVGAKPAPEDLDQVELAAWTTITRTILNLHEAITRN